MDDAVYLERSLELARHGLGLTSSNPLVGCVIVADGSILGEGYHHRFGGPHAEVLAINQVQDESLLRKSTLYVNLEPCSHHGKTPPCTDLIIKKGIPRVVIGCKDPNPLVSGSGIKKMEQAGIEVITGLHEKESRFLNRRFITFHEQKRPWIILKWAETQDGFMDALRNAAESPSINWITHPRLKMLVHRWRHESDAILAGAGTVMHDDPLLTTREWPGNNPLRVIIDMKGELDKHFQVFHADAETWFYSPSFPQQPHSTLRIFPVAETLVSTLGKILYDLYRNNITSLFVEGGKRILETFIDAGLWDEARIFTGSLRFGKGLPAPVIPGLDPVLHAFGNDILRIGYRCKQL